MSFLSQKSEKYLKTTFLVRTNNGLFHFSFAFIFFSEKSNDRFQYIINNQPLSYKTNEDWDNKFSGFCKEKYGK